MLWNAGKAIYCAVVGGSTTSTASSSSVVVPGQPEETARWPTDMTTPAASRRSTLRVELDAARGTGEIAVAEGSLVYARGAVSISPHESVPGVLVCKRNDAAPFSPANPTICLKASPADSHLVRLDVPANTVWTVVPGAFVACAVSSGGGVNNAISMYMDIRAASDESLEITSPSSHHGEMWVASRGGEPEELVVLVDDNLHLGRADLLATRRERSDDSKRVVFLQLERRRDSETDPEDATATANAAVNENATATATANAAVNENATDNDNDEANEKEKEDAIDQAADRTIERPESPNVHTLGHNAWPPRAGQDDADDSTQPAPPAKPTLVFARPINRRRGGQHGRRA
jgi:hypothetical protein